MKLTSIALAAALTGSALLAGCADDYYYPYGPPYAEAEYYGYYDGFYGPFYGGYWGPGGYFYYADRDGRHFHRDRERHFRRDNGGGARYREFHGRGPAQAGPHDGAGRP